MQRDDITPVILTYNEAPNIGRALARLGWAARIVVVDSGSTDETVDLCRRHPQVEVVVRPFDDHTSQWNFGVDQVRSDWVLALDADYILSDALIEELTAWLPAPDVDAYFASFRYCVNGRPLRASLYPPRAVLFRRDCCRYVADGHTQRLRVDGPTGRLRQPILHDDRKPFARWWAEQRRYAALEAEKLTARASADLRPIDRWRRIVVPVPLAIGPFTLIGRGVILDGWPGWYYAWQRTLAEVLLAARIVQRRIVGRGGRSGDAPV